VHTALTTLTDINLSERSDFLAEIRSSTFRQSTGARHLQFAPTIENKQMGGRYGWTVDCSW
jgi:hypothetical protein